MGVLTRRGHGRRTELALHHRPASCVGDHPRLPHRRRPRLRLRRQARLAPGRRQRHPVGVRAAGPRRWRSGRPRSWPGSSGSRWSTCSRPTSSAPPAPSGCPTRTVYLGHALPNALTASLTLGGLLLSGDGRRHGAGRERLRLARARQHDRVLDPQQGLPGRAGDRARLRRRRAAGQHRSSTSPSPCSTRAR